MVITLDYMADYRSSSGGGAVVLDDCNFHESVHLDSFDIDRTLSLVSKQLDRKKTVHWNHIRHTLYFLLYYLSILQLISHLLISSKVPSDGEFPVMNYRMTQEIKPPFRINALIEEAGSHKVLSVVP